MANIRSFKELKVWNKAMDPAMEIFEITQKFPPEKRYSQRVYLFVADRRSALPTAWSDEAEPKTTVEALYAAIKTIRGKPWPEKLFLDGLNAAIGQGFIHRMSGSGPISSLAHDGKVRVHIKKEPLPPPSLAPISGRKITNTVILNAAEVQSLGEEISHLTKALAGCDPQVEVRISIRSKPDKELSKAAEILEKIKPKWRF